MHEHEPIDPPLASEAQDLLARERAARASVERFAGRLMQLQAVTAALAEALTLPQVAEVIMGRVCDVLGAATCTVRLIDREDRTLTEVSSVGKPAGTREQYMRIPLDTSLPVVEVATTGRPFFFESLGVNP